MTYAHLVAVLTLLAITATAVADPIARPVAASSNDRVAELIEQLGADDFKTRAAAAAQLRKIGRSALPALRNRKHADPEIASWCAALTEQLDPTPRPDVARLIADQVATLRTPHGRVIRMRLEHPAINGVLPVDVQLQMKQLNVQGFLEVEAEVVRLRQKLEDPVQLRLILPRVLEGERPPVRDEPVSK